MKRVRCNVRKCVKKGQAGPITGEAHEVTESMEEDAENIQTRSEKGEA